MKILLTGSHGLVGSALMRSLEADGHEVRPMVRYALEVFDAVKEPTPIEPASELSN